MVTPQTLVVQLYSTFEKSIAEDILRGYLSALELGSGEDISVMREPEVSFNPRPSRIANILIELGMIKDPKIIIAGFYCSGASSCPSELRSIFEDTQYSLSNLIPPKLEESRPIMGALILDTLRHMHMSSWSKEEKEKYLSKISNDLVPSIPLPNKLFIYINSAVERAKKIRF